MQCEKFCSDQVYFCPEVKIGPELMLPFYLVCFCPGNKFDT